MQWYVRGVLRIGRSKAHRVVRFLMKLIRAFVEKDLVGHVAAPSHAAAKRVVDYLGLGGCDGKITFGLPVKSSVGLSDPLNADVTPIPRKWAAVTWTTKETGECLLAGGIVHSETGNAYPEYVFPEGGQKWEEYAATADIDVINRFNGKTIPAMAFVMRSVQMCAALFTMGIYHIDLGDVDALLAKVKDTLNEAKKLDGFAPGRVKGFLFNEKLAAALRYSSAEPSLVEVMVDEEELYERYLAAARASLNSSTGEASGSAPADVAAPPSE